MPLKPATVEAYLAALSPERRERFELLRATVLGSVGDDAVEVIAYDMPAYKVGPRFVCSIGAFKAHDSLFPASQVVIDRLGEGVAPYVKGRGTLQFPVKAELPVDLIGRIVRIRREEVADAADAGKRALDLVTTPVPGPIVVRRVPAEELDAADLARLLDLFGACWPDGDFTPDDVTHAMGGVHWLADASGRVVGHASVVPRWFEVGGRRLGVGYVEAVATHPAWQRRGVASRLLGLASTHIREQFELGALSTGVAAVYRSNGWEHWRGPTYVATATGLVRTDDEDGGIMILRTPRTPASIDVHGPIACDWRPGDVW